MPYNSQKVLQDIYNNVAKLQFGDLLLLQVQIGDHIHNCWQHHQLLIETAKEKQKAATQPSEQALPTEH